MLQGYTALRLRRKAVWRCWIIGYLWAKSCAVQASDAQVLPATLRIQGIHFVLRLRSHPIGYLWAKGCALIFQDTSWRQLRFTLIIYSHPTRCVCISSYAFLPLCSAHSFRDTRMILCYAPELADALTIPASLLDLGILYTLRLRLSDKGYLSWNHSAHSGMGYSGCSKLRFSLCAYSTRATPLASLRILYQDRLRFRMYGYFCPSCYASLTTNTRGQTCCAAFLRNTR